MQTPPKDGLTLAVGAFGSRTGAPTAKVRPTARLTDNRPPTGIAPGVGAGGQSLTGFFPSSTCQAGRAHYDVAPYILPQRAGEVKSPLVDKGANRLTVQIDYFFVWAMTSAGGGKGGGYQIFLPLVMKHWCGTG